ncbi:thioredoxin-like protein [Halteromyces radiatus]|uniref:thioredoxin-like protein n=1 Tax=Halteromyces radiatus TaxID=101107 RepID=UPI002220126A|nr:thioredoxin-like protein [Halteromyces radiatus]KAI8093298.1 thioredoxin-like protein [Halteromyces radiatus]
MRLLLSIFSIFSIISHTILAQSIELDKPKFDTLTTTGFWLVEHFSPYCHFCIAFAPTWKEFTEEEAKWAATRNIHFGTVDCMINGDLCKEHKVTGFPMIMLYQDGQYVDSFTGTRTKEALKEFLMEHYTTATTATTTTDTETIESTVSNGNDNEYSSVDNIKVNPNGQSIDLDSDTLKKAKEQPNRPYFIKFYAPWCGHCQRLAPIWNQMALELKNQLDVGEVNCDIHRELCQQNQVDGFPTLKLFVNGQEHEYSGDRSLHSLLTFAKKMAGPTIKTVNEAEFKKDLDPNGVAFLYLHKDESDSADALLETLGRQFIDGLAFYKSTDQKLVRQYELSLTDLPLAMIVKDGHHFLYPGHQFATTANMEALTNWIELEKYPVVTQINPVNAADILQGQRIVVLGLFSHADENAIHQFRKLAEKGTDRDRRSRVADRAIFCQLDMDTYGDFAHQAYNIQRKNVPAIVIVDGKKKQYFNRDANLNLLDLQQSQTILKTLDDAVTGKIKGISTLSLPARLGQHLQDGYYQAKTHSYVTMGMICLLGVIIYNMISNKRKQMSRGSVLPTTHQD